MSLWIMLLLAAPQIADEDVSSPLGQYPPISCDTWPIDQTITLPTDRQGLASALFTLNRGGAMREFSAEMAAAPALARGILADGRIDAVEQDILCEMTHPKRGGRVRLTIGGKPKGTIWAHRGYTEGILQDALKGKAPPDVWKPQLSQ